MSIVPIIELRSRVSIASILLRKLVMSDTCDFVLGTMGLRKVSMKADTFSVAQLLADTIGLPGGGKTPLCILGKKKM